MSAPSMNRRNFINTSVGLTLAGPAVAGYASEKEVKKTVSEARIKANETIQRARNIGLELLKPTKKQLEQEKKYQIMAGNTEDYNECVNAFVEKRKPVIKGK